MERSAPLSWHGPRGGRAESRGAPRLAVFRATAARAAFWGRRLLKSSARRAGARLIRLVHARRLRLTGRGAGGSSLATRVCRRTTSICRSSRAPTASLSKEEAGLSTNVLFAIACAYGAAARRPLRRRVRRGALTLGRGSATASRRGSNCRCVRFAEDPPSDALIELRSRIARAAPPNSAMSTT